MDIWDELLHGEEKSVWADKGYVSAECVLKVVSPSHQASEDHLPWCKVP
ncbi:hypothetical protein [Seohaeicola sp.]